MSTIQTAATQAAADPSAVLEWLRAGNRRFARAEPVARDLLAQARAAASGQFPLAAVLGCIDSRVPVELVFDAGIGDLFAARTAGNVVDADIIGSLEFAAALAGVKAIVVLGHTSCGAVMGACDGAELGHLTQLLAKITPAVQAASGGDPTPGSGDSSLVEAVVTQNVRNTVDTLLERSEVLRSLVESGDLAIVGAVYQLDTGVVEWLDD